jgi:hypothetical protein
MKYILYINRSLACKKSTKLKQLMTDELWQLVKVEYMNSTSPFLEIKEESRKITEVENIISFLQEKSNYSANFLDQARNAQKAARKIKEALIKGEQIIISNEQENERRSACSSCSYKTKSFGVEKCDKCGCYISLKIKFATENCPIGKWK